VADGLLREFNLTDKRLSDIAKLYLRHYNNIAQVYAAIRRMMGGSGGGINFGGTMGGGVGPQGGGINYGGTMGSGYGPQAAEGGNFLANRPTSVTFGEAGLEMASFRPIGRKGQDVNKVFSNMSGGGGSASGAVTIELLLSPDLEARVVQNSLNKTAEIVTRIQRSK
jgi:hypothetical protein